MLVLALFLSVPSNCLETQATQANDTSMWTSSGPTGEILAMAVDPANGNILYAGRSGGVVFKSTDGGASWELRKKLGDEIRTLRLDPLHPDTVYAGLNSPGLFKSTNGGASWDLTGLNANSIRDLAISPNNSAKLFAAVTYDDVWGSNVFLSLDGGAYWDPLLYTNLYLVTAVLVNPTSPNIVYAGGGMPAVISRSVDGGYTWSLLAQTFSNSGSVNRLVMSPNDPNTIYALISDQLNYSAFKSGDGGVSWQRLPIDASALAVDSVNPNTLYAGTYDGGVFRSTDGGATWSDFNNSLTNHHIHTLVIDASGKSLHAGTDAGVFDYKFNSSTNPIDDSRFFVRQHYLDFLSREPELGEPWTALLNSCPDVNNDAICDRITVSAAFLGSPEFHLKGYFVYRFYKLAFNRLPDYGEIVPDMYAVTGQTPTDVFEKKATFTNAFVQRSEFVNAYNSMTNVQYVAALLGRYGLTQITTPDPSAPDGTNEVMLTNADLTNRLDTNTLTRAQVLRAIADSDEVSAAEYNQAFVAMQYYGYLRRAPEMAGYNDWLNYLNAHPSDFRTMVNGFVNSIEYRSRFGP